MSWARLERLAGAPLDGQAIAADSPATDAGEAGDGSLPQDSAGQQPPIGTSQAAESETQRSEEPADEPTESAGEPPPRARRPSQARPLWTCVMHPQVHEAHPGPCPICGMPLTLREGDTP